ncbi:hypothetical protein BDV29DRAFT_177929 [Aspergillus leporis]|uniref:Uncharacterized protein n=1 Tax=Aspergillus leporis TaxID=41062 RepID=A0A5N5WV05_9EURO|nr:hypothetical protein BDV29DRAFT_177929 [Aspergillus leporis]
MWSNRSCCHSIPTSLNPRLPKHPIPPDKLQVRYMTLSFLEPLIPVRPYSVVEFLRSSFCNDGITNWGSVAEYLPKAL